LVVDTNVMVEAITSRGPYHKIFQSFFDNVHVLVVSNEIILEYLEVMGRVYSENTVKEISIFFELTPTILRIDPHYRFGLIESDPDDNKFVDCAICGNCDFLITSDQDFKVLKAIEFPRVNIISPDQFIKKFH